MNAKILMCLCLPAAFAMACATAPSDVKCQEPVQPLAQAEPTPEPKPAPEPEPEPEVAPAEPGTFHAYDIKAGQKGAPIKPQVLREDDNIRIAMTTLQPGATAVKHTTPYPITVFAISGTGTVAFDGKVKELNSTRMYYLDAGVERSITVEGDEPMVVLVHHLKSETKAPPASSPPAPAPETKEASP